jgi:hypothetical protein
MFLIACPFNPRALDHDRRARIGKLRSIRLNQCDPNTALLDTAVPDLRFLR